MLGKHVLDGIEDGLAVFGANGKMLMSNDAYDRIWGARSESVTAAVLLWESRTSDLGAGFAALRHRLTDGLDDGLRDSGAMVGPGGDLLSWSVASLGAGRMLVQFRPPAKISSTPVHAPQIEKQAMADDPKRSRAGLN